jgi:hypothetical protein
VLVRNSERAISIRAFHRHRRSETCRIWKRIEAWIVGPKDCSVQRVLIGQSSIELDCELILFKLGWEDISLPYVRVSTGITRNRSVGAENASGSRRRNKEVAGGRIPEVQQRDRGIRNTRAIDDAVNRRIAICFWNRGENPRIQLAESCKKILFGARAAD